MASESGERRAAKQSQASAPPAEPEHLPCPRCDSTNTKFCYYNNYNFSQPRHFCKSCRRYWTHGGTLRDIPVGGGSRKNAKRSRISAPSTAAATLLSHDYRHISTATSPLSASLAADHGGTVPFKAGLNVCGSFTSLLNTQGPAGLLVLGGFGLGIDEMGFGFGRALRPFPSASVGLGHDGVAIGSDGANVLQGTWQLESGEGGFVGVGDF